MKNKLISLLIISIIFLPKVNIINVPGFTTGIRLEDLLILILTIIFLKEILSLEFNNKELKKILLFFTIYFVCCIFSLAFGYFNGYINLFQGMIFVLRKLEYFICIYFGYKYFKLNKNILNIKNIGKFVDFVIIFNSIICLLQYNGVIGSFFGGSYSNSLTQWRISSIFNGSYELCAFLLFTFIYYFYNALFKKDRRILNIIYSILIAIIIFISESRISLLILIFMVFVLSIKKIYKVIFKHWKSFSIILIAVLILGIIIIKNGVLDNTRFSTLSIDGFANSISCAWENKNFDKYLLNGSWYGSEKCLYVKSDPSFNLRFNHWAQLLDGFMRNPVLGLGPSITTLAADGNYVRILTESGLLGLLAWLLLILCIIKSTLKEDNSSVIIRYCLYSVLIGCIFIDVFEASKVMMTFWFILGALFASREKSNIKQNKNTIIIVNDFDYVQGGASKVALDTAKIIKTKYNVVFFSAVSNNEKKTKSIRYVSTNQKEALNDKNKLRGIINCLYNFKAAERFKKLLNEYNPENTIIHVHGWTKALSSSIFREANRQNFKVVLTLHDYFTACPNGGYFNYKKNKVCKLKPLSFNCIKCNCDSRNYMFKLYRIVRHFIQNKIIKTNKKIEYAIGISDLNIEVLKETLPNAEIRKILNPIELNLDYSFNLDNDYYLYLGRVTKEKGVEIFASTMQKYNKKGIVVGDGSELKKLKEKYPNVEFAGWKNKEEVNKYIKKARALIVPSLWYEGAPLTPLEAMSFGVPCIISNVCSGKEYITNNGYTFNPYIEDDLINKINMLDSNIKDCSLNSFEYVKKFDKSNYLRDISKFYDYILSKK